MTEHNEQAAWALDILIMAGLITILGGYALLVGSALAWARRSPALVDALLELGERVSGAPLALPDTPETQLWLPAVGTQRQQPPRHEAVSVLPPASPTRDDDTLVGFLDRDVTPPRRPRHAVTDRADTGLRAWKDSMATVLQEPHLIMLGNTGSGKTVLARALLVEWAVSHRGEGEILVLDPKNRPGKWGDAPVVGIDANLSFAPIRAACRAVMAELRQRQLAMNQHGYTEDDFTPLLVLIDEYGYTASEVGNDLSQLFVKAGRIGRELRVKLVVCNQSQRVADLGVEGKGDLRDNYGHILLGEFATQEMPDLAGQRYPAVLRTRGQTKTLDTRLAPVWAKRDIDAQPFDTGIPVSDGIAERYTGIDTSIPVHTGMEFAGDDSDNEGGIDAQIVKVYLETHSKNKTIERVGLPGIKQKQLNRVNEALRRAGILEGN
jgi:hypothetical protein